MLCSATNCRFSSSSKSCTAAAVDSIDNRANDAYAGWPERFYIEVQKHIKEQDMVNPELEEISQKLGVGLVATNDVHFLLADDHDMVGAGPIAQISDDRVDDRDFLFVRSLQHLPQRRVAGAARQRRPCRRRPSRSRCRPGSTEFGRKTWC